MNIHTRIYMCIYICINLSVIHVYVQVYIHTYVYSYIYIHIYIYAHMYTCMCVYVDIYIWYVYDICTYVGSHSEGVYQYVERRQRARGRETEDKWIGQTGGQMDRQTY